MIIDAELIEERSDSLYVIFSTTLDIPDETNITDYNAKLHEKFKQAFLERLDPEFVEDNRAKLNKAWLGYWVRLTRRPISLTEDSFIDTAVSKAQVDITGKNHENYPNVESFLSEVCQYMPDA